MIYNAQNFWYKYLLKEKKILVCESYTTCFYNLLQAKKKVSFFKFNFHYLKPTTSRTQHAFTTY